MHYEAGGANVLSGSGLLHHKWQTTGWRDCGLLSWLYPDWGQEARRVWWCVALFLAGTGLGWRGKETMGKEQPKRHGDAVLPLGKEVAK
jgi:hypothetical protein